MRFLFFDIECCDGQHICEFGYVIADERLYVVKTENILMNPEERFCLSGRRGGRGLTLTHTAREYFRRPNFVAFYQKIRDILQCEGQATVGFSTSNDVRFLRTACQRYGLAEIDIGAYFDVQWVMKTLFGVTFSLENAAKQLDVPIPEKLHESSQDALLTLDIVKALCEARGETAFELFANCKKLDVVGELNESLAKLVSSPEEFGKARRNKLIGEFAKRITPRAHERTSLTGKRVCFSALFEKNSPKECLVMMQRVVDMGGKIWFRASGCDVYIKHDDDDENDGRSRYRYVARSRRRVAVVTMDGLAALVGVDRDKIKDMPVPRVPEKKNDPAPSESTSVGEILKFKEASAAVKDERREDRDGK